jgi:hypothetical protein
MSIDQEIHSIKEIKKALTTFRNTWKAKAKKVIDNDWNAYIQEVQKCDQLKCICDIDIELLQKHVNTYFIIERNSKGTDLKISLRFCVDTKIIICTIEEKNITEKMIKYRLSRSLKLSQKRKRLHLAEDNVSKKVMSKRNDVSLHLLVSLMSI